MMERLTRSAGRLTSWPSTSFNLSVNQAGPQTPDLGNFTARHFTLNGLTDIDFDTSPININTNIIELLDIWGDIATYILWPEPAIAVPFWQHNSHRARIQTRLLDYETRK